MNRTKFIVVEKSYLLRKGIVSVINRIEYATVIKELESLDNINFVLKEYKFDFIVFNPNLLDENASIAGLKMDFDLEKKGIALSSVPPYRKGILEKVKLVLHVNDPRDVLYEKLESLVSNSRKSNQNLIITNELSDREKTILKEVAQGKTNKEIAEKLYLSTHTVITHRKNITAKLGIKTISGLTVYAILNNLVRPEEIKE